MVTQQILVLLFQVRILVAQLKKEVFSKTSFFARNDALRTKNRTVPQGRPIRFIKVFPPVGRGGAAYSVSPILSMSALVSGLWPRKRT